MSRKSKIICWIGLLVSAFLVGFAPQYSELRKTRARLQTAQQNITSWQFKSKLSQIRDLVGLTYLETTRKNYGIAGQLSYQLFSQLQQAANETSDPNLKKAFEEMLAARDGVTAGLAKGDPAILADLQSLFIKAHQNTTSYQ
ncbi:MAG: hypothetical protein L0387_24215 [Acidobacteria bacterium]|nr:hypothetical protein [Acidobacteriota bacterium]MCI0717913.1 hypothetical protein [Acidobacteriota bacterium]